MKKLCTAIVALLLTTTYMSPGLLAYEPKIYLNPGFKVGYTFGESDGFTWGLEISVTRSARGDNDMLFYGGVLDVDFGSNWTKIHCGAQSSVFFGGLDIGPTFLIRKGETNIGFSFIPFIGVLVLYPYFNYSYFGSDVPDIQEIGTYVKLSRQVSGEETNIRFAH